MIREGERDPVSSVRCMEASDWIPVDIPAGRYCNELPLTGYVAKASSGKALHPDGDDFEERLKVLYSRILERHPGISLARRFVEMPWSGAGEISSSSDYRFVPTPERLVTTSVSVITAPRRPTAGIPSVGFFYDGTTLSPLRERLLGGEMPFLGLCGNLGYLMTGALIEGNGNPLPYAHNRRFPDFKIPVTNSHMGFFLFRRGGDTFGAFQGAHPGAVAIDSDGGIDILTRIDISSYRISIGRAGVIEDVDIDAINPRETGRRDLVVYTPGFVPEVETDRPMVPASGGDERVNLFVANEGNGEFPEGKLIAVWEGSAPIPSFGAVLSFSRDYFQRRFGGGDSLATGEPVNILPNPDGAAQGDTDLSRYDRIIGGLLPVVVEGRHLCDAATGEELLGNLEEHGHVMAPVAELGRESRNFDLRVREPAGLFIATETRVGWVLFDGRHELSIGANLVDMGRILALLEGEEGIRESVFRGEEIQNAVVVDGGSALKVYLTEVDCEPRMNLLNRVAAGSRNAAGDDPLGLNAYSLLKIPL